MLVSGRGSWRCCTPSSDWTCTCAGGHGYTSWTNRVMCATIFRRRQLYRLGCGAPVSTPLGHLQRLVVAALRPAEMEIAAALDVLGGDIERPPWNRVSAHRETANRLRGDIVGRDSARGDLSSCWL